MATRLASTRNFITVTSVTPNDAIETSTSISTNTNTTNSELHIQRTNQMTPVSLHHINLSQVREIKGY